MHHIFPDGLFQDEDSLLDSDSASGSAVTASVEGVTAKNNDCQEFWVENNSPVGFKKPLISYFLLLVA